MDNTNKPFNVLEGYFDIPETMVDVLKENLKHNKAEDLHNPSSQLYRLFSLRKKLKKMPNTRSCS
jgi:hypothetical protein